MLWRLVSEGYLSSEKLEAYSHGVISAVRHIGYDVKLYKPTPVDLQRRTYGYYLKQVEEIRQRGLVSSGKIDELLLDAFRDDIVFGVDQDDEGGEVID